MKIFALKHNKNILKISSSGGAYSAFAETLFNMYPKEVVVFGVEFSDEMLPEFRSASTIEKSRAFCGSKYVFANPQEILEELKRCLINKKYVLFVGTPCNIHTIVNYLKKNNTDMERLYTIDLICNGTPSVNFWQEYVKWLERKYGKKLVDFKFRKKGGKNNPYLTEASFIDDSVVSDSVWTACYNQAFLKKLSIRRGCFNCPYKSLEREADLTIGDFWGISTVLSNFNEKDEVSEVLVNSEKGKFLMDNINPAIKMMECKNEAFVDYQQNLIKNSSMPRGYEEFWRCFNEKGIDEALSMSTDAGKYGTLKYGIKKIARAIGVTKLRRQ